MPSYNIMHTFLYLIHSERKAYSESLSRYAEGNNWKQMATVNVMAPSGE